MASITCWTRLEADIENSTIQTGLQAHIHDPLWLVARQWQLGEFQGEDAGSPINAKLQTHQARLSRLQTGALSSTTDNTQAYDPNIPLEAIVERERVYPLDQQQHNLRIMVETGLHFLCLLRENNLTHYCDGLIDTFPIQTNQDQQSVSDDVSYQRFLHLSAQRCMDGFAFYQSVTQQGAAQLPPVDLADQPAFDAVFFQWRQWYENLYCQPNSINDAWIAERNEYQFSVAANTPTGERVLNAPEYEHGELDWFIFDEAQNASLGANSDPLAASQSNVTLPHPVRFRGMPAARWWEFEDAQVNFDMLTAAPQELGKMLMLEFVLSYSNDWFVIPLQLDVGCYCMIESLEIIDTFGQTTQIKHYAEIDGDSEDWRLFANSQQATNSGLLLAPTLGQNLYGEPIEEILLLRDEMANMAWGVEKIVEGGLGQAIVSAERPKSSSTPAESSRDEQNYRYRMSTSVPDYWIPLLPVKNIKSQTSKLKFANLVDPDTGDLRPQTYRSKIFAQNKGQSFYREEVPRAGRQIRRQWQFSRWIDGSSHVWIGKRVRAGRGEGTSGLHFDDLVK